MWARSLAVTSGRYGSLVPEFFFAESEDDEGRDVWVVEDRPPLREGKVFVGFDERATIAENLEAAYVAVDRAFRGIWIDKALEWGQVREFWDDGDIDELEALTVEASAAVERAGRALSSAVEAHSAQEQAELGTADD